jgi:Ca-activated chloride channel family protein
LCAWKTFLVLLFPLLCTVSCKKKFQSGGQNEPAPAPKNALELVFTYGSEKEKWITEVTAQFNREGHRTASGKPIFVRALPMGEIMIGQLWRFRFNPN